MPLTGSNPALETAYANTSGPVAYLDETFQLPRAAVTGFYVFSAVVVERDQMQDLRDALREFAGGTYWHTTDELLTDDGRKKAAAMLEYLGQGTEPCILAHQSKVHDADTDGEAARRACLRGIVTALSAGGPAWGQVDAVVSEIRTPSNRANFDRKHVRELRHEKKIHRAMQVHMVSPKDENLLWLPDLVSSAVRKSITGQTQELLAYIHDQLHFVDPLH